MVEAHWLDHPASPETRGRYDMATPTDDLDESGALSGRMTRGQAIGRMATIAAGAAVAPALLASPALGAKQPTKFKDLKPFNRRVKPGPPTGLPRRVATNFPAGSQYFIDMAR